MISNIALSTCYLIVLDSMTQYDMHSMLFYTTSLRATSPAFAVCADPVWLGLCRWMLLIIAALLPSKSCISFCSTLALCCSCFSWSRILSLHARACRATQRYLMIIYKGR